MESKGDTEDERKRKSTDRSRIYAIALMRQHKDRTYRNQMLREIWGASQRDFSDEQIESIMQDLALEYSFIFEASADMHPTVKDFINMALRDQSIPRGNIDEVNRRAYAYASTKLASITGNPEYLYNRKEYQELCLDCLNHLLWLDQRGAIHFLVNHFITSISINRQFSEELINIVSEDVLEHLSEEYQTAVWALRQVADWKSNTPDEIISASEKVRNAIDQFLSFEGQVSVSLLRIKGALRKGRDGVVLALRQMEETEELVKSGGNIMVKERAEGFQQVAEALSKTGQRDKALVLLERAIELDATNAKSYMLAGKLYFRKGDVQKVVEVYESALERGLSFPHLVNELEKMRDLLDLTKLEIGGKIRRTADSEQLARLLTINGNILAMQGSLGEATKRYQQALLVCPDYLQANIRLGHIFRQYGDYESAVRQFELAVNAPLSYIRALAFDGLGAVKRQEKDYHNAIILYQQAINLTPEGAYANANNGLGKTYCLQGDYPNALQAFELALSIKPNAYWIINNMAIAQLLFGRRSEAEESFKKATELSREFLYSAKYLSHMNLGISLIGRGDIDEGMLAIRQALKICEARGLLQELVADVELIAREIPMQKTVDELRRLLQ